ncbi:Extreme acid sensitivity protein [Serratia fonticola]|uniref:Extreme acid sensitivity protein n=1 Tax=Serratia fonticola TaxID=47917 RepID=A0A4U9VBM8_SERFO|nr:Extreme acid sensitivity protein [Serratia fonticola]
MACLPGFLKTLGEKWGFAAISFGYLQIAIGFIPMLYFVLGALSYILNWPELNNDPIVKDRRRTDYFMGSGLDSVWWHQEYRSHRQDWFFLPVFCCQPQFW